MVPQDSDLHDRALRFVDLVYDLHSLGSGKIPVFDLISMFVMECDPSQRPNIEARGEWLLNATDQTCGTFQNEGEPLRFSQGVVTLSATNLISGIYLTDPDHCYFRFNPVHTIVGSAFFILSSKLKSVYVDRDTIKVEMDDPELSQTIKHRSDPLAKL